jgi:hypothetical protein
MYNAEGLFKEIGAAADDDIISCNSSRAGIAVPTRNKSVELKGLRLKAVTD